MAKFTDEEIEDLIIQMRNSSDIEKDHAAGLLYIGHKIMISKAADVIDFLMTKCSDGPSKDHLA